VLVDVLGQQQQLVDLQQLLQLIVRSRHEHDIVVRVGGCLYETCAAQTCGSSSVGLATSLLHACRMKASAVAVLAALAGCIDAPPPDSHPLPMDVHYIVLPAGYSSPEQCIANDAQPFSCINSLSLCKNGRAGLRRGDVLEQGTYQLEGSVAHITFESERTMDFDVDSVTEPDSPSVGWTVDTQDRWETLQFDNIDCSQP
jgi:hypothetical protein